MNTLDYLVLNRSDESFKLFMDYSEYFLRNELCKHQNILINAVSISVYFNALDFLHFFI